MSFGHAVSPFIINKSIMKHPLRSDISRTYHQLRHHNLPLAILKKQAELHKELDDIPKDELIIRLEEKLLDAHLAKVGELKKEIYDADFEKDLDAKSKERLAKLIQSNSDKESDSAFVSNPTVRINVKPVVARNKLLRSYVYTNIPEDVVKNLYDKVAIRQQENEINNLKLEDISATEKVEKLVEHKSRRGSVDENALLQVIKKEKINIGKILGVKDVLLRDIEENKPGDKNKVGMSKSQSASQIGLKNSSGGSKTNRELKHLWSQREGLNIREKKSLVINEHSVQISYKELQNENNKSTEYQSGISSNNYNDDKTKISETIAHQESQNPANIGRKNTKCHILPFMSQIPSNFGPNSTKNQDLSNDSPPKGNIRSPKTSILSSNDKGGFKLNFDSLGANYAKHKRSISNKDVILRDPDFTQIHNSTMNYTKDTNCTQVESVNPSYGTVVDTFNSAEYSSSRFRKSVEKAKLISLPIINNQNHTKTRELASISLSNTPAGSPTYRTLANNNDVLSFMNAKSIPLTCRSSICSIKEDAVTHEAKYNSKYEEFYEKTKAAFETNTHDMEKLRKKLANGQRRINKAYKKLSKASDWKKRLKDESISELSKQIRFKKELVTKLMNTVIHHEEVIQQFENKRESIDEEEDKEEDDED